MKFALEGPTARGEGLDAAVDIWWLMERINRRDTRMAFEVTRDHGDGERCAHPESVYANLGAALRAVLTGLGVTDMDAAWQSLLDGNTVGDVIEMFGSKDAGRA